jgi:DNA-binding NarL/FixJ family response regulator
MFRIRVMHSGKSTSIYIVDDSASIRQRLVSMLESIGDIAIVGEAETARDAIEGILATRPDSVLLDLHLRASSGIDVLKTIRGRLPLIKFVVLTNHAEPQYRRACTRIGAEYFLDKSTEFDGVRDAIAEIAANRQQMGEQLP